METVKNFKKSGEGVYAVASTTDSLKVLVEFLASPEVIQVNIPVRAIDIGTTTPSEIKKACDGKRKFSTVLGFGVDVTPEARQLAERLQVEVICCGMLETLRTIQRVYQRAGRVQRCYDKHKDYCRYIIPKHLISYILE